AHGRTVKHVFKHRGRYTVTLTVKDAAGNTATKKIRIKVS
ncbi:MAG: PKD domain-containing protein, partial [Solirubrobacterales bacterium]|nr:PKD domain-containing protein [Solirubrobacterales bacterium]